MIQGGKTCGQKWKYHNTELSFGCRSLHKSSSQCHLTGILGMRAMKREMGPQCSPHEEASRYRVRVRICEEWKMEEVVWAGVEKPFLSSHSFRRAREGKTK